MEFYYELLSQDKTINFGKYCNQLNKLKVDSRKTAKIGERRGVIFHHEKTVCCIGCKKKAVTI